MNKSADEPKIFIINRESSMSLLLIRLFRDHFEKKVEMETFFNVGEALPKIKEGIDAGIKVIIVTNLGYQHEIKETIAFMKKVKESENGQEVSIIVTSGSGKFGADVAMKAGAALFIPMPFQSKEYLMAMLKRVFPQ